MRKHLFLLLLSGLLVLPTLQNAVADTIMSQMEVDIDRFGNDLSSSALPTSDPILCENACALDGDCEAWTYVKAGTVFGPGSPPRCFLKAPVPTAVFNPCCVSGVKFDD